MANSILKWCKTKILSGYKHINVESSDEVTSGPPSDTEYLVRNTEEEFLLTPTGVGRNYIPDNEHSNSGGAPYSASGSPNVPFDRRKRSVGWRGHQGVTCDLSLSEDGSERKEFAFTLYDFHGQGKVTKDDITSLVQSIYDTVGSSLSLPPSGSRTVKVKLSVAPSERRCFGQEMRKHKGSHRSYNTPKTSPRNLFNDSYSSPGESPRYFDESFSNSLTTPNVTPRTDGVSRLGDSFDHMSPRQFERDAPSGPSSIEYLSPRQEDCGVSSSPRQDFDPVSPRQKENFGPLKSPGQLIEAEEDEEEEEDGELDDRLSPRKVHRKRNRKVQYQRHELLHMIQANMERNNLFYSKNSVCNHSQHHGHHRRRRKRPQQHHSHSNSGGTSSGCCCCGTCCHCCCGGVQKSGGMPLNPAALKARLMHYDNSINNNHLPGIGERLSIDLGSGDGCSLPSKDYKRHHRSRSQDLNTDSPHVFRHHLLDATPLHHHPLPPSNTPDRPTSPRVNHHHHNHNHHSVLFRHRSRSCEGEEPSKEEGLNFASIQSPQSPLQQLTVNHSKRKKNDSPAFYLYNPHPKYKGTQDHHRDLNEVVSWLEKSSFKDGEEIDGDRSDAVCKPLFTTVENDGSSPKACSDEPVVSSNSSSTNGCSRSHHVHQHYHHHYHHYPTTSLII